jgi:hypothetical protein
MVDDRITDGKRIAQLLSSELSGRESGPLADVAVVDADPEADPVPDGATAYHVSYRDERVGTVRLYPDRADLTLSASDALDADAVVGRADGLDLDAEGETVPIASGAAVKRAVDALVAGLPDGD